jgi:hypothetical protein
MQLTVHDIVASPEFAARVVALSAETGRSQ